MSSKLPKTIHEVGTPCLLVDLDVVEKNCRVMRERCREMNVNLRPHMKTHKTLEAGELMTNGTKNCIVVSTLAEAEFFADGGFDDILYAYPFTQDKIPRLKKLSERKLFHVLVDSAKAVDWLKDAPLSSKRPWNVWISVDVGYGREGLPWNSPELISLVRAVQTATWCEFQGLYTHCGSSYHSTNQEEIQQYSNEAADRMLQVSQLLQSEGINCPQVATGSTPSCSNPGDLVRNLTEVHPGNYVFYDIQQLRTGSCGKDDIGVKVATRVIGHYPHNNRILVDCGFLGLSHDGKGALPNGTYCVVDGHPELVFDKMSQEIGYITVLEGDNLNFDSYPVGCMLYLLPYHSCATAAMHPFYYVYRGAEIITRWQPCRGW